jgi:hypothetical protein
VVTLDDITVKNANCKPVGPVAFDIPERQRIAVRQKISGGSVPGRGLE